MVFQTSYCFCSILLNLDTNFTLFSDFYQQILKGHRFSIVASHYRADFLHLHAVIHLWLTDFFVSTPCLSTCNFSLGQTRPASKLTQGLLLFLTMFFYSVIAQSLSISLSVRQVLGRSNRTQLPCPSVHMSNLREIKAHELSTK